MRSVGRGALLLGAAALVMVGCSDASPPPVAETTTNPSTAESTTDPEETPPEPVSLVAVGDIACDPTSPYFTGMPGFCEQEAVARRVGKLVRQGAKWFVPLGDLQYEQGGYDAFLQVYDRSFGQFMDITEPVPGNHEYYTGDASGYFRYFGKRAGTPGESWRMFSPVDGWQVLLLNSNCEFVGGCGPSSAQGKWISKSLAATNADCVVAAWHHPLRTSGEYYGVTDSSDRAAELWELVDAGGADLVLNGHDHLYERFKKFGGVQQFTVGTGGKNPYDITASARGSLKVIGQRYGVLKLTMDPRGTYEYAFVATDGEVLDSGTGRCTNEPE